MKRTHLTITGLIVVILMLAIAVPAVFAAPDSYEDDSSLANARLVVDQPSSIDTMSAETHSIDPVGDEDWYKIILDEESNLFVRMDSGLDSTDITLKDSGGSDIEHIDSDTYLDRICGDDALAAGTYYIVITEALGTGTVASYDISIDATPCLDAYEPDDEPDDANLIVDTANGINTTPEKHSLYPDDDVDLYKLILDAPYAVNIEVQHDDTDFYYEPIYVLTLTDADFEELDYDVSDESVELDFSCDGIYLTAGTYYATVQEDDGDLSLFYDITVTLTPCGDEYEVDNTLAQAREVVNTGTNTNLTPETHSIDPIGDRDWYKVVLDSANVYSLVAETSGPSGDTVMQLYDSGGSWVETDDDSGTGSFSLIDRLCGVDTLAAGTYYLEVFDYNDDETIDSYDMTITVAPCPPEIGVTGTADFGSTPVDGGTVTHTFTVNNTGTGNLTLGTISFGGANPGDFSVSSAPGLTTIPPGGNTTFDVTFDPSAAGERMALMSIFNNDQDEDPFNIDLTGFGAVGQLLKNPSFELGVDTDATYWKRVGGGSARGCGFPLLSHSGDCLMAFADKLFTHAMYQQVIPPTSDPVQYMVSVWINASQMERKRAFFGVRVFYTDNTRQDFGGAIWQGSYAYGYRSKTFAPAKPVSKLYVGVLDYGGLNGVYSADDFGLAIVGPAP